MRSIIFPLLVGVGLTIGSTAAAAYAERCAARCEWHCDRADRFDRCMRHCVGDCSWHSASGPKSYVRRPKHDRPPSVRSALHRHLYGELAELFLRFLPEVLGAILAVVLLLLRAIKRGRNLRISTDLNRRASAMEREAADLRAEAFRRMYEN
jgi:hypothetical protein